jgi:hydrogenase-1 operon protein HyaE
MSLAELIRPAKQWQANTKRQNAGEETMGYSLNADVARQRMPTLDAAGIDDFLGSCPDTAVLLFRGDTARNAEADDIAVVLPQLLDAFAGRLHAAVIAPEAEAALLRRFDIKARPCLALVRAERNLGTIAKIQDWSVYLARIGAMLADDAHSAGQGAVS